MHKQVFCLKGGEEKIKEVLQDLSQEYSNMMIKEAYNSFKQEVVKKIEKLGYRCSTNGDYGFTAISEKPINVKEIQCNIRTFLLTH